MYPIFLIKPFKYFYELFKKLYKGFGGKTGYMDTNIKKS